MATNVYMSLYGVSGASATHPDRGRFSVLSMNWSLDRTPGGGTFDYHLPIIPTVVTAVVENGRQVPQLMARMISKAVSDVAEIAT